jgi:hypothetical protein
MKSHYNIDYITRLIDETIRSADEDEIKEVIQQISRIRIWELNGNESITENITK